MLSDTLSLHYTVARPENYGLYQYKPVLSTLSSPTLHTPSEYLEMLHGIQKESLGQEEQLLYTGMERKLSSEEILCSFPYYLEPCAMNGGAITNLLIMLSEYTFYRTRDVEDYLSLLSQTDTYFQSISEYESKRQSLGLSSRSEIYKTASKISETLSTLAPKVLTLSFEERLGNLALTNTQKDSYIARHEKLLQDTLGPAYQTLAQSLQTFGADTTPSLCTLPGGKEFYQTLFSYKTGVYEPLNVITAWLKADLSRSLHEIQAIIDQYPMDTRSDLLAAEQVFLPEVSENGYLHTLLTSMKGQYPALLESHPQIKQVWSGMESMTAPAFYLSTPIDKSENSLIYINPASTSTPLETFTTLAHEGFPGHLYQNVYQNQYHDAKTAVAYNMLGSTGYCEGWALYSEFRAYEYLATQAKQKGNPLASDQIHLEALYRKLQLAVFAYMDIAIHYFDVNSSTLIKQFSFLGFQTGGMVKMYQFIQDNPCYYPAYYVGYLALLDLQNTMQETMGKSYTPYKFHQFYLQYGPNDFTTMKSYFTK